MFRLPALPAMQATWPHDAMIPGKNPGIFLCPPSRWGNSHPLRRRPPAPPDKLGILMGNAFRDARPAVACAFIMAARIIVIPMQAPICLKSPRNWAENQRNRQKWAETRKKCPAGREKWAGIKRGGAIGERRVTGGIF